MKKALTPMLLSGLMLFAFAFAAPPALADCGKDTCGKTHSEKKQDDGEKKANDTEEKSKGCGGGGCSREAAA